MFLYTWDKKERKTVMTEKEFKALCDLVENAVLVDETTLIILKKFIKRYGRLLT